MILRLLVSVDLVKKYLQKIINEFGKIKEKCQNNK